MTYEAARTPVLMFVGFSHTYQVAFGHLVAIYEYWTLSDWVDSLWLTCESLALLAVTIWIEIV